MAQDSLYLTRQIDGVLVVQLNQSHILDAVTIERMTTGLKELIDSAIEERFLFDFDKVTYLSSNALGMLIGLNRRVIQRKGHVKLSGINNDVMEIFRITKLDTVFDIYKDAPSAIEAYRKNL
jgi:anti-sigma B factor antagonist